MRQGQAVAVPDGDVHHPGGGQLLDELRPERRGLGGTAAETGAASPRVHLRSEARAISTPGPLLRRGYTRRRSYLSGGGQGQRRLAPRAHLPDEHALEGFHHLGLVDPIGVAVAQFP